MDQSPSFYIFVCVEIDSIKFYKRFLQEKILVKLLETIQEWYLSQVVYV